MKRPPHERICTHCMKTFYAQKPRAVFCSSECHQKGSVIVRAEIACANCGKKFKRLPNAIKNRKYNFCSSWCAGDYASKGLGPWARGKNYKPKKTNKIPKPLRWKVLHRDDFTCVYCGRSPETHGVILHVDHIDPAATGGKPIAINLNTSCEDCNVGKADIQYESNELPRGELICK